MNGSQKLLIIGLGKMGGSLLERLISERLLNIEISVIEPNLNETNKDLVVKNTNHYSSIDEINTFDFDVVIFAIKPQIMREVCEQISLLFNGKYFSIISILAGIKIKTFGLSLHKHFKPGLSSVISNNDYPKRIRLGFIL